jgi:hypothetical protein
MKSAPLEVLEQADPKAPRILLIMVKTFNYSHVVSKGFYDLGYSVYTFNDRPSTNNFIKGLLRINRKLVHGLTKKHLANIIAYGQKKDPSIVLLINGQSFLKKDIQRLKEAFPQARFLYYTWDSLDNYPEVVKFAPYFEKCYSFDSEDVKRHPNFRLLPLFYAPSYAEVAPLKEPEYDFFYCGTAHPKKYGEIEAMKDQLTKAGYHGFVYEYLASPLVYHYYKLKGGSYKGKKKGDFNYRSLSAEEMARLFASASWILDSQAAHQSGLTMRTLECLGARRKLITTNPAILSYDFYRPENIYLARHGVIDPHDVFFNSGYVPLPPTIYEKYSLKSWCQQLLQ